MPISIDDVENGFCLDHEVEEPIVDIVVVPGLGTDPLNCWSWEGSSKEEKDKKIRQRTEDEPFFNWITSENGLPSTFPGARILRYAYRSAWTGELKIETPFQNIVNVFLGSLKGQLNESRPVIFIAHSMGGLVVAQALADAEKDRESYGGILRSTVGCLFFGTPFLGTEFADLAALAQILMKKLGMNVIQSNALLQVMKPHNEYLTKLSSDLRQLARRLSPPIELCCFYEERDFDPRKMFEKLGHDLYQECTSKKLERFVTRESAISVATSEGFGLDSNHPDLVKFENNQDGRYVFVLSKLTPLVDDAVSIANRRRTASKQSTMTPAAIDSLRNLLDSGIRSKHNGLIASLKKSSWIVEDELYKSWEKPNPPELSCFWLIGRPGMGKTLTLASLAAIRSISERISRNPAEASQISFLCDTTQLGSSPIELLKSLVLQLINQKSHLTNYAKHLLPRSEYRSSEIATSTSLDDTKATMSLQNLWNCLSNILSDPSIGHIYIVISNIHHLERSKLSEELINSIQQEFSSQSQNLGARRWLFTSTQWLSGDRFEKLHDPRIARVVDLSTSKYAPQVKNSLEKYVQNQVQELHRHKSYTQAQRYLIQELMTEKAYDKYWIDIQCIRLEALSVRSSMELITSTLGLHHTSLGDLVTHCWSTVLDRETQARHSLTELLIAMALAIKAPSINELSILSGIMNKEEVLRLVEHCAPMLQMKYNSDGPPSVEFGNEMLKYYLLLRSHKVFGSSEALKNGEEATIEAQRSHGVLAWRCFAYMDDTFSYMSALNVGNHPEEASKPEEPLKPTVCSYPMKFCMDHAIKGKAELSDDLVQNLKSFWTNLSPLRTFWLTNNLPKSETFTDGVSFEGMTALHTAAAFGYDRLITSLIHHCRGDELKGVNKDGYTPVSHEPSVVDPICAINHVANQGQLHIAAIYDRGKTIEAILDCPGAGHINDLGKHSETALHLAAVQGHTDTVKLLLERGANPNAVSNKFGPVISAAIRSGDNPMVQLLLHHESMNLDLGNENQERFRPPLAISAGMSTQEVFKNILLGGKDIWRPSDDRAALIEACSHNKPDNVKILLDHEEFVPDNNSLELAMLSAAVEDNWSCVPLIFREGLVCNDVFYLAAISEHGDVDNLLRNIWNVSGSAIPKEVVDAALYQATDNQKLSTVKWLLRTCGANANATDEIPTILLENCPRGEAMERYGDALTAAAWDGTVRIVEELIKSGAVVDSANGCALQMAAREGHAKVVDILLQNGADINRIPGEQEGYKGPPFADGTALQVACIRGRTEVVTALLSHKERPADPNLGRGKFIRPILAATRRNRPEILRLLLDAPGINVNKDHGDGMTPLINATEYMSADAVRMLIDANANVNEIDVNGDTALIHAAHKGDAGTLQLLIDNNANFMYESPRYGFAFSDAVNQGHVDCMRVFSNPISRIFRGLNNVIASGSVAVRDLVARPDDKHEIVDMEKVRQLQTQVEEFRQELLRIDSYRVGWAEMEAKVHQAEADMLSSEQKMDEMRQERSEETSRIEKERESYSAAVHGFKKLQEENAKLEQRLAGHGNELAALKQTHASEVEDARRHVAEYQEKLRKSRDNADEARRLQANEIARLQANEIARLQGIVSFQQSTAESSSREPNSQRESYRTNDSPSINEDQEDGSTNGERGTSVASGGKKGSSWKDRLGGMTRGKSSDNNSKS